MRLVTYRAASGDSVPGVDVPDIGVVDLRSTLNARHHTAPTSIVDVLRRGTSYLDIVRRAVEQAVRDVDTASERGWLVRSPLNLLAPLGQRTLIVCAGANYASHVREMGEQPQANAAWFVKSPNAICGPGEPIMLPASAPSMVDYEGELAVVIGRDCHAVDPDSAIDYVAGYTIVNDVSARDANPAMARAATPLEGRTAWTDMLLGKQYPTFCPIGPAVVTADMVPDPSDLHLTTTVNGAPRQDTSTSDLIVGVADLIAQLSRYFSFRPGDVISTGSPAGVGFAQNPPVFLRDGDHVAVTIQGIGELANPVTVRPSSCHPNHQAHELSPEYQ